MKLTDEVLEKLRAKALDGTITDDERGLIIAHIAEQEDADPFPEGTKWWFSFSDGDTGKLLGVTIAEGTTMVRVLKETRERGCNPENSTVLGGPLPEGFDTHGAELWKLHSKEELEQMGFDLIEPPAISDECEHEYPESVSSGNDVPVPRQCTKCGKFE